jgi:hypothetical protein
VFTTFAVAAMVITTGAGPQEKVITPPFATAATTAADVQLAGVPLPITRVGWEVSTAAAAAGIAAWPLGFPGIGNAAATAVDRAAEGLGEGEAEVGVTVTVEAAEDDTTNAGAELATAAAGWVLAPQPVRENAATVIPAKIAEPVRTRREESTRRW